VDPETAADLHPNHSQRIQRALEIYRLTGVPASMLKARQSGEGNIAPITEQCSVSQVALLPKNRALLHSRIAQRFLKMLELGFEQEVRALHERGDLTASRPAVRAVGYRQMWQYLEGEISRTEMVDKAVAATRQLAKRQLTWLRGWPDLHREYIDDGVAELVSPKVLLERALKVLR
jgi:tRNA dimethylallyltransferase